MPRFKPSQAQIVEWIETNFDYRTRRGGEEYLINSPFNPDSGYNFNINVADGICHDWRGDEWAKGAPKTFLRMVQVYRGCSFTEAVREVCGKSVSPEAIYARARQERTKEANEEARKALYDIKLPEGSRPITDDTSLQAKILRNWLHSRGVSDFSIKDLGIHYHDSFVVWPYYEYDSLVYYQERNHMNKIYLFPSNIDKSHYLYGFDLVEPSDYVVVTEAIFDKITLGNQTVATGGAIMGPVQVRKIRALNPVNGVILSPDNDKAGIKSLVENYHLLNPYCKVFYSLPPKIRMKNGELSKDWNELGEKKLVPWDEIPKVFEQGIKPLTLTAVANLMKKI